MIAQEIQQFIGKKFIGRPNIMLKSRLKLDLWFDDVDIDILLNMLEKKFAVRLPEKIVYENNDVTVQHIVGLVEQALVKKKNFEQINQKVK